MSAQMHFFKKSVQKSSAKKYCYRQLLRWTYPELDTAPVPLENWSRGYSHKLAHCSAIRISTWGLLHLHKLLLLYF
jgi:hypothetical protein